MDFIIFAALMGVTLHRIIITYDVICSWLIHFRKRMAEFPESMRIPDTNQVDVAIPGWHINGHGEKCRDNFNLSYMEGAGRMVGEDIETTWAGTNPLAPSVREMGPAARHDTLNDHWNGWNFRKIVGFRMNFFLFSVSCCSPQISTGTLFLKHFNDVYKMSAKQKDVFNQLSATFPSTTVKRWELKITTWEANYSSYQIHDVKHGSYHEQSSSTNVNEMKRIFIHSRHSFHLNSDSIVFHSFREPLHWSFIPVAD